jgi:hypothetical protein
MFVVVPKEVAVPFVEKGVDTFMFWFNSIIIVI